MIILLSHLYSHRSIQFRFRPISQRTARLAWLVCVLLSAVSVTYAQRDSSTVLIDQVPAEGLKLRQGWRFHAGDLPNGASPHLDDSRWKAIDPVRDIRELPEVTRASIGWLRLHLTIDPRLPPLQTFLFTTVASEVYFDGQLLYQFGKLSNNPDSVVAYNPYAAYPVPYQPGKAHLLALRIATQPNIDYQKIYLGMLPSPVRITLYPATAIPAVHPYNIASVYVDMAKISVAAILFILHLSLFLAYRRQRANLIAAVMYLLLVVTHVLRAGVDLMHIVAERDILPFCLTLYPFVIGLMFLTFYELFGFRKNVWFWFIMIAIALGNIHFPVEYHILNQIGGHYQKFELFRIIVVSTRRKLLGAWVVAAGIIGHMALSLFVYLLMSNHVPVIGNEWLYESGHGLMFLCIPLALSLRLALENGWVNRQLGLKLTEVADLAAQNIAQQREQQDLLAKQNEQLEHQVDERTKELRRQAEQLKELDEVKSRFVTNLTHEFRTPLSLIISPVAKLLESAALPDTIQTTLQTVDRNARHLLNQINQLLDISRLEEGRMSLTLQPVQAGQLTSQLVDLFNSSAEAKQITLTLHTWGNDQPYLIDTDKWGKIVYNLLANALKFTPTGGQVDVQLWLQDNQVRLAVIDTGIGIAADKLPFIFDRFYQADDDITRSFEGTGVGLALVRELTVLMGGSVDVESQSGKGSTFTVSLPLQAAPSAMPINGKAPQFPVVMQAALKNQPTFVDEPITFANQVNQALVLVVEDNDELCNFMAVDLSTRYRILTATNGQQGWELIQQYLPDLIISDVMMPRMDGFQLTRLIKTNPSTDHIAVILLTAKSAYKSRLEGLQKGADAYLVKPFDLTELRLSVSNLIMHQYKRQAYHRRQLTQPGLAIDSATSNQTDPFLERVYQLLDTHLDNSRMGVEWLADQLAMDRKTFYRKLQSKLQLSPAELIRTYRLRRGSELLRSGKTVTETAYSVGFESVTYFGQCFKEVYQMTPTEFINQRT